jgi:hypothetical protein
MRIPDKAELPLSAAPQQIPFDLELVAKFRKAFRSERKHPPFTWGAVALQGVFQILKDLQVDWHGLLHVTQKFEYMKAAPLDSSLIAIAKLKDARSRGGMVWLQFEIEILDQSDQSLIARSSSLVMVKGDS